jgi:hypothetical protein
MWSLLDHPDAVTVLGPPYSADNWHGLSVYHPDRVTTIGNVRVVMSMQGMLTPSNAAYAALFRRRAVKYIRIEVDGVTVWETWSGEMPPTVPCAAHPEPLTSGR